jgi:5-oxoprolinase (ATP-hydrolysing) subunit A
VHQVDLNCDMGESFGPYALGNDDQILEFVTSANIACGFHAGDPSVMKHTVRTAVEKGVRAPGLPRPRGLRQALR